jgi:ribosomal protein S18 acetylase RimI-like enzyme
MDFKIGLKYKNFIDKVNKGVDEKSIKNEKNMLLFKDLKKVKFLSPLTIRRIKKKEFKSAELLLQKDLFKNKRPSVLSPRRLYNSFKKYPYFFIGVFLGGEIVGVIGGGGRKNTGEAVISVLCVNSKFRGRGLGKRLVEGFEKQAMKRGYNVVKLGSNDESIGFYKSLRYKPSILIQIKKSKFNQKIRNKIKRFKVILVNQVNNYKGVEIKCGKLDLNFLKKLKHDLKADAVQYLFTKEI